ncbi:TetR/AcrR family transcriptional regulator [Bacillus sp. Au-Bac7]|uniref:TetR/AcrR family transcriptional regulator n=1 Tax=Bacillus sp. Au-Bac7 TaxID=2906458 RepID=UPI001E4CC4E8|nr:TetR-like C-terminal domain-containing protein [Bacillus sp. Au-Bac7]MCE4050963.1 TetR family transcriptional regulator C-terminal domain-containing protein [Bacillus sp. Au-Bac7]
MTIYKKEDPRSIRSKEMIKNAVFELLAENHSVTDLTIKKITTKANLNRTTFYLHYQDIQDLLAQIADELLNSLSEKITALTHTKDLSEKQKLTQMLDNLYAHRIYLLRLFSMDDFEEQLFGMLKHLVETRRDNSHTDLPEDYVTVEIKTASLVGIIMWWIRNGLQYSSEYIAKQISLLYRG